MNIQQRMHRVTVELEHHDFIQLTRFAKNFGLRLPQLLRSSALERFHNVRKVLPSLYGGTTDDIRI